MATKYPNNVRHSIGTTGTGNVTFGAVPDGWQALSAAGVADGDRFPYELREGNEWEIGWMVASSSVTTGARTVLESSNSDAAIDLQGAAVLTTVLLGQHLNSIRRSALLGFFWGR